MHGARKSAVLGVAAAAITAVPAALPASGAAAVAAVPTPIEGDRGQCVTHVLSREQLRAGELSKVTCFASFADVLRSLGYENVPNDADSSTFDLTAPRSTGPSRSAAAAASTALAVHCDNGACQGGDKLTVVGADCTGGGLALSGFWNNRISATQHWLCYSIKHFVANDFTGTYQITQAAPAFVRTMNQTLNNDVSSIIYLN